MQQEIRKILLRYWGYHTFRPLQEDIILSVLEGKDTLALLPTGGGKSVCFQVPALAREGLCLVITPLIALMKDQVINLKNKQIKAAAIYSGMHSRETEMILDNAVYGDLKFLYISPERLETDVFREKLLQMNLNILAIDEAHCISQWGYDFRPPYLKIAEARDLIPGVPVLALTATATPEVVDDIQDKLKFSQKNVFRKSFERRNLAYIVMKDENKYGSILKIIQQHPGTGIIYVRNRRKTREVADYLRKNKISADFYHAGLEPAEREKKQDSWIHEKTSIMVSTNAFGMGIDKPNVRFVIHIDLPDSPEAYFQEAGRGGRDEKESIAVLLYDDSDVIKAQKNFENSYPGLEVIKSVYQAIGNYYQLATGSGKDLSLDFDINEFSDTFRISPVITYNSLRFLEKEGYLALNETFNAPARLLVSISHEDLYRFQVENPRIDPFIKLILRIYSGLFTDYVNINENDIAKKAGIPLETVIKTLKMLDKMQIFSYLPARNKPQLIFLKERADVKNVFISPANYSERKAEAAKRLESVINYVTESGRCRSQSLLAYFGEKESTRCGKCDVCLKWNRLDMNDIEFEQISAEIKKTILNKALTLQEILFITGRFNEDKTIEVIRWLEESGQILKKPDQRYTWKRQFKLFS